MSKRALKQQQKERANLARSVRLANADFTSKAVDLVSSDESETDSLVSFDYDTQEDDYFQDDDDDNGINLVIKQLLAASAASFKKRSRPA
ncbi:8528_t:CDS:2, partial [Gigaspora rosea]